MTAKVSVFFLPDEVEEAQMAGQTVIVVDLLRASTTIAWALHHGARAIIPMASPSQAKELRDSIGRDSTLLCGERLGRKIEGFDLGNSPLEYTPSVVRGKTLVFASSNGSAAMVAGAASGRMAVAGLVNLDAAVEWAIATGSTTEQLTILCSGKLGQFSAEDAACAGALVARLAQRGIEAANDAARVACDLGARAEADWLAFLERTDHGLYLTELGFARDLAIAAELNSLTVVPVWQGGRLGRPEDSMEA